jgi:hypothetical protein
MHRRYRKHVASEQLIKAVYSRAPSTPSHGAPPRRAARQAG